MSALASLTLAANIAEQGVAHPANWFALYTCANHEKRVASYLLARELEHFLPLSNSMRRWKDRRVRLQVPLFPGYVFVRVAPPARVRVLNAPGAVRLIGINGQPTAIPDAQIESLRCGVNSAACMERYPELKIGARVRVVRGPLAGAEGSLVRKKKVYRVVITVEAIARAAAIEVDVQDVEKIS